METHPLPSNLRNVKTIEDIFDTSWKHFIGIVRGPVDMDIYINCHITSTVTAGTGGNTVAYSNTPGRIGAQDCNTNAPSGHFVGFMDEFAFWNRELQSSEIASLCNLSSITTIEEKTNFGDIEQNNNEVFLFSKKDATAQVTNLNGKVVYSVLISKNKPYTISKKLFKNGIYIVSLIDRNGELISSKMLVHQE